MHPSKPERSMELDETEYYHLALRAGSRGDHHACFRYVRKVLRQRPRDPWALYLRATQHAELGFIERAIDGIEVALAIEPTIEVARLHLSLLLLLTNRPAEAKRHLITLGYSSDRELGAFSDVVMAASNDALRRARKA